MRKIQHVRVFGSLHNQEPRSKKWLGEDRPSAHPWRPEGSCRLWWVVAMYRYVVWIGVLLVVVLW